MLRYINCKSVTGKIVLFIVSDKKLNEYIETTLISNFGTFACQKNNLCKRITKN